MIFDEWAVVARARNRAESLQLKKQLDSLDKQKYQEMVLLNNKKKIYKKKYLDLNTKFFDYHDEFVTCETQAPRGTGNQMNMSMVHVDYNFIHDLVFTKDAVDIEKLLVLHLLSVHKSETLAPPRHKLTTLLKENSPTARLIEKSRRPFFIDETIMDLLPFYTIEISELGPDGEKRRPIINRDSRLANRVLFNRNLRKLIITVLSVLHKSNFSKFKSLVQLAQNPDSIKKVLMLQKSREFIEAISEQLLINSPENFTLTSPFKLKTRDLNIKTPSGSLENFIKTLRSSVLQIPVRTPLQQANFNGELEPAKLSRTGRRNTSAHSYPCRLDGLMSNTDENKFVREGLHVKKTSKDVMENELEDAEKKKFRRLSIPNFIQRNIKQAGKTKKIEYDIDDDLSLPGSSDIKKISYDIIKRRTYSAVDNFETRNTSRVVASTVAEEPSEVAHSSTDVSEIFKNSVNSPMPSAITTETKLESNYPNLTQLFFHNHQFDSSNKDSDKENVDSQMKFSIKHSTCPACIEKWKMPRPTPKTPRLQLTKSYKNPFKTDSKQKIELLINKELFILESYDRRFSANTSYKPLPPKKEEPVAPVDNISVNPMFLARIEQEIREKETQRKLEKFLNETI